MYNRVSISICVKVLISYWINQINDRFIFNKGDKYFDEVITNVKIQLY